MSPYVLDKLNLKNTAEGEDGEFSSIAIVGTQMSAVNDTVSSFTTDNLFGYLSGTFISDEKLTRVNEAVFVSASTFEVGKSLQSTSNVRMLYPRTTLYPDYESSEVQDIFLNSAIEIPGTGGKTLRTTTCLNYPSTTAELNSLKSQLSFPETGAFFGGQSPVMTNAIGETKWEAGDQFFASGGCLAGPFYESYGEYAEEIRAVGKDYSVMPEFRISEHMEYYVDHKTSPGKQGAYPEGVKDVSASISFVSDLPQWLSLTGTAYSSSTQNNMFSVYSTTDFLKHFKLIEDDHEGRGTPTAFSLKCKALMKFLPYDGFYPQDRTLQLANLFSRSYAPSIKLTGSEPNFRTALQPFFTPGILYNSIKSGLAVDYPVYQTTSGAMSWMTGSAMNKGSNQKKLIANLWNFYDVQVTTGSSNENEPTGTCVGGCDNKMSGFAGNVESRIPFEAIINPKLALQYSFPDDAGFIWSRLDSTASMHGTPGETYSMAMHNFLAETMDFFLENKGPTLFKSKPESDQTKISAAPAVAYKKEEYASLEWTNNAGALADETQLILIDGEDRSAIFVFDEAGDGSSAFSAPPVPVIRVDPSADGNASGTGVQKHTEALVNAINASYLKIHGTTDFGSGWRHSPNEKQHYTNKSRATQGATVVKGRSPRVEAFLPG
jgi:hypothetical protein